MQQRKIRIVHIEDRFHPEMGYQINYTAKYHGNNIDMHIISSNSLSLWTQGNSISSENLNLKDKQFEEETGVKIHRLPLLYEKRNKYNLFMKGLLRKIYSLKPDIVFIHSLESYTAFFLLSKSHLYKDFTLSCDTHTLYNQFNNKFTEKIYFYFLKKVVISKINQSKIPVFYTAEENKKILTTQYRVNPKIIFPYPIGTDNSVFFKDRKSGADLRKKLRIDENKKIILYTGKFNYAKSPHLLLDTILLIKEELPDFIVIMLGGKNKDYFNKYFQKSQYEEKIPLLILDAVKVKELNAFYNMADIAVFPKENTLSSLDCQLSGLPVIMEENPTNRERLKKGGLCYKKDNLPDLAEKITQLLKNNELHNKLSDEGLKYIKDNYLYKNIIRKTETVLISNLKNNL